MISNDRKLDLLTGAIEGGSTYWFFLNDLTMIPSGDYIPKSKEVKEQVEKYDETFKKCLVNRMWEAVQSGAEIPIFDYEDREEQLGVLSKKSMNKAVKLMMKDYQDHLADVLTENDDACTADVFFQLAVMGEIVFG